MAEAADCVAVENVFDIQRAWKALGTNVLTGNATDLTILDGLSGRESEAPSFFPSNDMGIGSNIPPDLRINDHWFMHGLGSEGEVNLPNAASGKTAIRFAGA